MSHRIRGLSFVALAAATLACGCRPTRGPDPVPGAAAPAAPTGIARFTRFPQYERAKISPQGTYLAVTALDAGKRSLTFIDLRSRKVTFTLRPASVSMVGRFYWVNDTRVIVELVQQEGDLAQPKSYGELYAVDARGGSGRLVFGYRAGEMGTGSHIKKGGAERSWATVVDTLRGDDRRVLVETLSMDTVGDGRTTLQKLDVYTGVTTQVAMAPAPAVDFITDENGWPRVAVGRDSSWNVHSYYRDPDEDEWRELSSLSGLDGHSRAWAFSAARRQLYVTEQDAEGMLFAAVDVITGARTVLARNPVVPPSDVVLDPRTNEPILVRFDPDLPSYEPVSRDHPLVRVLAGLQRTFAEEQVDVVSATDDLSKVVVLVYSDRDPGRYLLVDSAALAAEPVVEMRPWIDPASMAPMGAFRIVASDGLAIHGYLTVPSGVTKPRGLPLVVVPHGGPHDVRDYWGFDPEAQLFASRGFAVLQVNFRGSGGYGGDFRDAAFGHWGDRVQQDIIEATRFVVAKGYVDPRRVCIFGASFGGYSAMQSAILAPDLFRCAVGYAGVYDLALVGKDDDIVTSALARGQIRTSIGSEPAALKAASPVYNADKLGARVMLVHGAKDERAPITHAERLRDALAELGRPVEWLVAPLEGHGFYDEKVRERTYAKVLEFIEENTRPETTRAP